MTGKFLFKWNMVDAKGGTFLLAYCDIFITVSYASEMDR